MFEIFKTMQKKLGEGDKTVIADYNGVKNAYKILGIFVNKSSDVISFIESKEEDIPEDVKAMAQERWQAKQSRDWGKADELRAKLLSLGYEIKDSKEGYQVIKNN